MSLHFDEQILTVQLLRELITYVPWTGDLFWNLRRPELFQTRRAASTWNARYANTRALSCSTPQGYLHGDIFDIRYFAHVAAWAHYHGEWPGDLIDHKDQNKSNNRIGNLRPANKSQNGANRKKRPGTSSQFLGVRYRKDVGNWSARIKVNYVEITLGSFNSEAEAASAYDRAAARYFGEFATLNFPEVLS